ncbi:MAG TPA: hypothetical protein VGN11_01100, partial [Candidatus Baltobacteraceae bacterium]|nr:hypothetical protein [Candidatus Baltobacteraceae bacterium]
MARTAESIEIRRTSLLERLERVGPKIVACVAPAGFGKTTLVRQYLAGRGAGAVLDCAGVRDGLDLARRLIPALGLESPEREPALTRRELMLGDGSTSVAERVQIALEAWEEASGGTIVFENAEHIAPSQPAHELFVRLLAHRPPERTVAICSRENLRLHLTRYAPPHEIMVLRAHDLVFDATDVRMIFAQYLRDEASIDRIVAISQGWPIAVLLLKRLAAEGRFNDVLDRLHDVTFEEL